MQRLIDPEYMKFPFRVGADRVETSRRSDHVREQIEQVLFTDPKERIFRPDFGAGVRTLVFEPNGSALWQMAQQRLKSSLAEALRGEVDPADLDVQVVETDATKVAGNGGDQGERLVLLISYRLATINRAEQVRFRVPGGQYG